MLKITLETFAAARDRFGFKRRDWETTARTVGELAAELQTAFPAARDLLPLCRFAVNDEYAALATPLADAAVVSIMPPVSGGAPAVIFSSDPISLEEAMAAVRSPACGALSFFVGTVREENAECRVTALEYEAKVDLATRDLEAMIAAARGRFDARAVFIRQRLGRVAPGEATVVIAVASPHRQDAQAAVAWLLEEMKRSAPIWKKEERLTPEGERAVWLGKHEAGGKS